MGKIYKIAAINLGSTSTKVAYYENETCILKENITHPAEEIRTFATIWDQYEYRKAEIRRFLEEKHIALEQLDAIVTRGGHTVPINGGLWKITETMLQQSASEKYGNHATDLGLKLAYGFGQDLGIPAFTADTPSTCEFEPLARISGHPLIERRSRFHVLNHRAVCKQYAADQGKSYESLRLVVAHLGGGTTVSATKGGKLVDANNGLDGDGPFSTNRTGGLPVGDLVKLCFSGEYTYPEVKKMLNGNGGMMAYLGENDVRTVQGMADAGDEKAQMIIDAMCYQTGKEIASMASVLEGKVDAILLTGGIVNSRKIVEQLTRRVGWIAPVVVYPGELEMQSLCLQSLAGLRGEQEIQELV